MHGSVAKGKEIVATGDSPGFGELLRQWRGVAKLTQRELGSRARLGARTISDLERGKAEFPQPETMRRLVSALGLSGAAREQFEAAGRGRGHGDGAGVLVAKPGVFGTLIAEKTRDFVGRKHVFEAVDGWVAGNRCGYLTLRGEPGYGKSAFVAEYALRTGCPAYFNQRAIGMTRARQFLQSIHEQLTARVPALAQGVAGDDRALAAVLRQAADQWPGDRLIIAVDALDEVDLGSQDRGSNILYLPPQLPDGVYFLLTKRDVQLPLVVDVPAHSLDLGAAQFHVANLADVCEYLERVAELGPVAAWLRQRKLAQSAFVTELARRSAGNFMYLHHVVQDIAAGRFSDIGLDAVPDGLHGYYADHWHRMGMDGAEPALPRLKVIYVLLEYQEPVTVADLARITGERAGTVVKVVREWRQFLRVDEGGSQAAYSLYHQSFADFLRREEVLAASQVDLADINGMIADDLFQDP